MEKYNWYLEPIVAIRHIYDENIRYIDNVGFLLRKSDLAEIKLNGHRVINGLKFEYTYPDIIIHIGGFKYIVATQDQYGDWYTYKFNRYSYITLTKVLY